MQKKPKVKPGDRFDRLVVDWVGSKQSGSRVFPRCYCTCDCGNKHEAFANSLKRGEIRSCGCLRKELASERMKRQGTTHGMSRHPLYKVYKSMIHRCHVASDGPVFETYRGRGIEVCKEWRFDFEAFARWAFENGYKSGLSLDRRENNAGYSPDNCRWTTPQAQANNTRSNRIISAFGATKSLADWTRDPRCQASYSAIRWRLSQGVTAEEAITRLNPRRRNTKKT